MGVISFQQFNAAILCRMLKVYMLQRLERFNTVEICHFSTEYVEIRRRPICRHRWISPKLKNLASVVHFRHVLEVLYGLWKHRPSTGRAFHFADVALADHGIEYRGRTSVTDAQMPLEQRC